MLHKDAFSIAGADATLHEPYQKGIESRQTLSEAGAYEADVITNELRQNTGVTVDSSGFPVRNMLLERSLTRNCSG